jgi:hypothetical protein
MLTSPVFTVLDTRLEHPFLLRMPRRAAVVAFLSYPTAHFVARALEQREVAQGVIAAEPGPWDDGGALVPAPFSLTALDRMRVLKWTSADDLAETCKAFEADLLLCQELGVRMYEPIEFTGRIVRL